MSEQGAHSSKMRAAMLACLIVAGAGIASAQGPEIILRGTLTDLAGEPAVGHRVVFRSADAPEVFLSSPTDAGGEYSVSLPAGGQYVPFSVLLADGGRIELGGLPALSPAPNIRRDLQVDLQAALGAASVGGFDGSDRLYLAFVEDVATTDWFRTEGQFEFADGGSTDSLIARFVGAVQFPQIPGMELGGRLGFGSGDLPGGGSESGLTDLDVWAKLRLPVGGGRVPELAVGGLITLPVGSEEAGLGFDSARSKLFAAARFGLPRGAISTHLGLRANQNGTVGGVEVEGKTAIAAGVGLVMPLRDELTLIGELGYEGERFEGGDPDGRALVGVNWQAFLDGHFRFAVGVGFDDGAPDLQVLAGYALEF